MLLLLLCFSVQTSDIQYTDSVGLMQRMNLYRVWRHRASSRTKKQTNKQTEQNKTKQQQKKQQQKITLDIKELKCKVIGSLEQLRHGHSENCMDYRNHLFRKYAETLNPALSYIQLCYCYELLGC